jgi:hypothetical protein
MNIRKIIREEIDSDWDFMDKVSDVDFLNSGKITDDELIEIMKTIGTEDVGSGVKSYMLVTDTRNGEDFIVEWEFPMSHLTIRTLQIKNYEETGGMIELEKYRHQLYRTSFFREKLNSGSWEVLNIIPKSDYK